MLKKLSQILLIIIFFIVSFCVYLSVYGINTDKLNGIINEKISERDNDFDIKLNKIKIFLDIGSFKLEAKTKNPIIFYKKNKIDLFAFISNKKGFFDSLLPGQKNLNFAFYSKDKNILNNLNKDFNDIQYIDSDLDYII